VNKSDLLLYGFFALVILILVALFGSMAYSDMKRAEAEKACEEACWPAAAKRIDQVCHCGTVEGWVRQ